MTGSRDLDAALGAWADAVRLDEDAAAAIASTIVGESRPAGLPPNWWRDFSLRMSGVVVRASRAGSPAGLGVPAPMW